MASDPDADGWPDGADPELVRECNCDYCTELTARLDGKLDGEPAPEPEPKPDPDPDPEPHDDPETTADGTIPLGEFTDG